MKNLFQFFRTHPWIILTLVSAVIIIGAARMHELWGDEAETALFARNILKYGLPRGWDGTNIMGINNGIVLDNNLLNHTSPWAQYYMVAASFALFGQSSLTARIPSIVLYIVSIPLLYFVVRRLTGKRSVATLAAIVATFSVQGILFGYQARYYELTNVAGLVFFLSAFELMEKKRWPPFLFILSGIIFFYANYVSWAAFYVAVLVGLLCLMLSKRRGWVAIRVFIMRYLMLSLVIVAFCAPWYFIMQPMGNRGAIQIDSLSETLSELYQFTLLAWSFFHISDVFPLGMALVTFIGVTVRLLRKKTIGMFLCLLAVSAVYLFIMALFTTITNVDTIFVQARYTTVLLPIFYIIVAMVIFDALRWNKWLGIVLVALYLGTNLLMFSFSRSFAWSLAREIVHPYQTPEILVANYLKIHAHKGDTAFVNYDSDHEPLIFQLGDQIRFVNRVTFINTRIFPKNRDIIPRYIYDFPEEPDWVILFGIRQPGGSLYTSDARLLWQSVDLTGDYTEHIIPVYFADMSRPEIAVRSFSGVSKPDPIDFVYIYEKKQ